MLSPACLQLLAVSEASLPCGFASVVALPLVAWFSATALPLIETYLLYVYCVLVVRAWTYEYGLNQMYVGGFLGINHRFSPLGGSQSLLCITNGV
jgi:hypothetical protein